MFFPKLLVQSKGEILGTLQSSVENCISSAGSSHFHTLMTDRSEITCAQSGTYVPLKQSIVCLLMLMWDQ